MNLVCFKQSAKLAVEDATKQLINLNQQLAKLSRTHSFYDCLSLFHHIHTSGTLKPDQYSLSSALTSSASIPNLRFGIQLHAHVIFTALKSYPHVSNSLLSLYAKSEDLGSVKKVFYEMGHPDSYSWTTMLSACAKLGQVWYACQLLDEMSLRSVEPWNAVITGCSEIGDKDVALRLFRRMHCLSVRHDGYTFAAVLSLCSTGVCDFGRQLHSLIVKTGFLDRNSVANSMLSMYFDCGNSRDACKVFEESGRMVHNEITYNAMINGLVSLERVDEALGIYKDMLRVHLRPTELTFVSLMSSGLCVTTCFQLHAQAMKVGFELCTAVSNAAMSMYTDHGLLDEAIGIFEKLEVKDVISWNTVISGYAQNDSSIPAVMAFMEMRRTGIEPDEYTIGTLFASSENLEMVQMLYALILKNGVCLISEAMNALISALSKRGEINQAYQLFCDARSKNLITWNAIISGFLLNGSPIEALEMFLWMQKLEIMPTVYTLTIVQSICASISSLRHGKQIHGYILRHGFSDAISLHNGLITMYSQCGVLNWSSRVFDSMNEKDIVSWNSIISAFSQYGEGKIAVLRFTEMQNATDLKPDEATFTAVLSACSHSGLVCDGIHIFNSMVNYYGFKPKVEHFSCLVDLLGRAGYLDEAEGLIESKDNEIDAKIWWTVFSACAAYGNVRLGRIVAKILLETEKDDPSVYVLLSNIHANAGQWEDSANVREMMNKVGVIKQPGFSWL